MVCRVERRESVDGCPERESGLAKSREADCGGVESRSVGVSGRGEEG